MFQIRYIYITDYFYKIYLRFLRPPYYSLKRAIIVPLSNFKFFIRYRHQKIKFNKNDSYILFYNGVLNGGTYTFAQNFFNENTDSQFLIIRPAFNEPGCKFFVLEDLFLKNAVVLKENDILKLCKFITIKGIIVNSLVYFNDIYKTIDLILEQIRFSKAFLTVCFHDYFSLCPNMNLEKNNGELCYKNCCFEKTCRSYFFEPYRKINHYEWKKYWRKLLVEANELRVFSMSSAQIVSSFYSIPIDCFSIKPHSMSYFKSEKIKLFNIDSLHIGIIGYIDREIKGLNVVHDFLNFAEKHKILVSVIGMYLYHVLMSKYIKICGVYKPEDLRPLIEDNGINVVLFPSVCPETFSYVVSELMQLGVPIVCFDYGAQAEKIRGYERGMICSSQNPEEIIKCAKDLFRRLKYNK